MLFRRLYYVCLLALLLAVLGYRTTSPARAACDPDAPIAIVSINNNGEQGNNRSVWKEMSADGRFISFVSEATNLAPNDTNNQWDAFVYDRLTCHIETISVNNAGSLVGAAFLSNAPISADGRYVFFLSPTIGTAVRDRVLGTTTQLSIPLPDAVSADGRYLTFTSDLGNWVPNDTNNAPDVFVYDRQTGQTERVSVASDGTQGNGIEGSRGGEGNISADGRYVSFLSFSTNLVPNDTNNEIDTFVHDRLTRETTRVSVAADGTEGIGGLNSLSADGRYVTFDSSATTLVPEPNPICTYGSSFPCIQVYVKDRLTGAIIRASVSSDGTTGNDLSYGIPRLSGNGRYVVFDSESTNLVPGDTNNAEDAFVHDRITRRTYRVSAPIRVGQTDEGGSSPIISADGRYISFASTSTFLQGYGGSSQLYLINWQAIYEPVTVRNGDFSEGMNYWATWDAITYQVQNGVFQFYRNSGGHSAALLQNTGSPLEAGEPLEFRVDLGNLSSVRKRVVILLHDADWSDLQVCSFWLPPNEGTRTYRMETFADTAWSSTMVSIYAGVADGMGWIQVDNVSLNIPLSSNDSTRCIDPRAPVP
jgi:Tol biopolymer transport system component